jgi:hypothetical protein
MGGLALISSLARRYCRSPLRDGCNPLTSHASQRGTAFAICRRRGPRRTSSAPSAKSPCRRLLPSSAGGDRALPNHRRALAGVCRARGGQRWAASLRGARIRCTSSVATAATRKLWRSAARNVASVPPARADAWPKRPSGESVCEVSRQSPRSPRPLPRADFLGAGSPAAGTRRPSVSYVCVDPSQIDQDSTQEETTKKRAAVSLRRIP